MKLLFKEDSFAGPLSGGEGELLLISSLSSSLASRNAHRDLQSDTQIGRSTSSDSDSIFPTLISPSLPPLLSYTKKHSSSDDISESSGHSESTSGAVYNGEMFRDNDLDLPLIASNIPTPYSSLLPTLLVPTVSRSSSTPSSLSLMQTEKDLVKDKQKGRIEFRDVYFKYQPDGDSVLRGVSFTAEPGQKVGIVGRTGSGKSSLSMCLFRFCVHYLFCPTNSSI